jgi:hypothetical protein
MLYYRQVLKPAAPFATIARGAHVRIPQQSHAFREAARTRDNPVLNSRKGYRFTLIVSIHAS